MHASYYQSSSPWVTLVQTSGFLTTMQRDYDIQWCTRLTAAVAGLHSVLVRSSCSHLQTRITKQAEKWNTRTRWLFQNLPHSVRTEIPQSFTVKPVAMQSLGSTSFFRSKLTLALQFSPHNCFSLFWHQLVFSLIYTFKESQDSQMEHVLQVLMWKHKTSVTYVQRRQKM